MATTKSSPSAHEPTTRTERALELYRVRGHEIERLAGDIFRVPSCSRFLLLGRRIT